MWVPSGDRFSQHEVTQREGGEQGNPPMPIHSTLTAVEGRLKVGEKFFARHQLDRGQDVHRILEEELRTGVGIRVHHGKTDLEQVRLHTPKEWTC